MTARNTIPRTTALVLGAMGTAALSAPLMLAPVGASAESTLHPPAIGVQAVESVTGDIGYSAEYGYVSRTGSSAGKGREVNATAAFGRSSDRWLSPGIDPREARLKQTDLGKNATARSARLAWTGGESRRSASLADIGPTMPETVQQVAHLPDTGTGITGQMSRSMKRPSKAGSDSGSHGAM